jgi:hypothetical protein
MGAARRISQKQLERIRWKGESAFRVLTYYFTVRWNRKRLGDYVERVLGHFAVPPDPRETRNPPTPGLPISYSLVDLGTATDRRFRLLYGEEEMIGGAGPGEVLEHLFWHINSETFRSTGAFLLVHAGSVATPDGVGVLLPGVSGAGKSTLTASLVRAGFNYLSDEAAAIEPVTRRIYPYPKAISLKKDDRGGLGLLAELRARRNGAEYLKRQWYLPPEEIPGGAVGRPCRAGLIVLTRYEAGAETQVSQITPAEGAFELAQHALNMSMWEDRALPLLADVARGAQSYRLVSGNLGEAVRAITGLAGEVKTAKSDTRGTA